MKKQDNPFGQIIDGILSGVSKETREDYSQEIDTIGKIKNAEDYAMYVTYPLSNILDEAIRLKLTEKSLPKAVDRVAFLYRHYHYVESHLEFFIVQREGTACSADKSRYIMNAYEKYFLEGRQLALPYSKSDKKDKCYWKPHFWDDAIWLELLEALIDIEYGKVHKYLEFMKNHVIPKEQDEKPTTV